MIFNFVVTDNLNPLYFEKLAEDGWGKYHEGDWSEFKDGIQIPLCVSDFIIDKYPVGFNIIPQVIDKDDKPIDKSTLKIQKVKLEFLD